MIQRKICGDSLEPINRVLFSVGPFKEGFPTAPPIQGRRWPLKPHRVTICEPESSKQRCECVSYERTIEPGENSGSDNDSHTEQHRYNQRPDDRFNDFAFHHDPVLEDFFGMWSWQRPMATRFEFIVIVRHMQTGPVISLFITRCCGH